MYRVGIDAHMLGDHSGGNETYYRNILENMSALDGTELYLFVTEKADISKLKEVFKIVYFKSHKAAIRNFIELPYLCLKYKLDLLHVQYFIPFIRPCKVVCTIHDICFERIKGIFTKKEYIRQKLLIPYAAEKSDKIITVSQFSKKEIAEVYKIDEDKIVVAPNAVDEGFHILDKPVDRGYLQEKYGIDKDSNFILTVGNLQPRKNISRLIQAYIQYKSETQNDLKLVIVGKKAWQYSDIFSSVNDAIEANQINEEDIVLTGYVEQEDLVKLYNSTVGFIYPSIYEGFGIPPLEAMACGANIAVSNIPSLCEVTGEYGIKFDPYDVNDIKVVIERLHDKGYSKKTPDEVRTAIEKFNWKDSSLITEETYLRVMNRGN